MSNDLNRLTIAEQDYILNGVFLPNRKYVAVRHKNSNGLVMHPVFDPDAYIKKVRIRDRKPCYFVGETDSEGKIIKNQ